MATDYSAIHRSGVNNATGDARALFLKLYAGYIKINFGDSFGFFFIIFFSNILFPISLAIPWDLNILAN